MKLQIQKVTWQKICAYIDNCEYEIGGLGKVTCDGNNFIVSDVEIFTQKVTAAHVDMTAETLAIFQTEKVRAKESMRDYKFWWHSHAKMKAFFSGTDTATIDESGAEFPWLVSFVSNHAHDKIARLDIYQPVHVHCELQVEIVEDVNQAVIDACVADIAAKVTMPPKYTTVYHTGGYYGRDDGADLPPPRPTGKLSKKEKKKIEKLENTLAIKERTLRHLEGITHPTVLQVQMIEELEEAIADISLELDQLQGLEPEVTKLPTPAPLPLPHRSLLE